MPSNQALFDERLSRSAIAFRDLVWPLIAAHAGNGILIPVEAVTARPTQARLDQLAGIDAWQVCRHPEGMRGIASRVQPVRPGWPELGWQTFTIRYELPSGGETEWAKRRRAIHNPEQGWLSPHLTVQAYVSEAWDKVLSCCCTPTETLILYTEDALERDDQSRVEVRQNHEDGTLFLVVHWAPLAASRPDVYVWPGRRLH